MTSRGSTFAPDGGAWAARAAGVARVWSRVGRRRRGRGEEPAGWERGLRAAGPRPVSKRQGEGAHPLRRPALHRPTFFCLVHFSPGVPAAFVAALSRDRADFLPG